MALPEPDARARWSLGLLGVHLFALCGFAVAQPLYDLIARAPEFLLVRRLDGMDVELLAAAVSLGPAMALWSLVLTASAFGLAARIAVQLVLVAFLAALFALPPLNRLAALPPACGVGFAALAGAAFAALYARWPPMRAFTTASAVASVVFPALFLLRPPASLVLAPPALGAAATHAKNDAPIVMLVFDEFPLWALVRDDGEIDATLFPNFARLARDATWYRNATTQATMTARAVGTIVGGTVHGFGELHAAVTRANNIFTLLGATHDLNVREAYVPFCPTTLCRTEQAPRAARQRALFSDTVILLLHALAPPAWASALPGLSQPALLLRADPLQDLARQRERERLAQVQQHKQARPADRTAALDAFIRSIRPSSRPTLHYDHVLLPHIPYVFEGSGRICAGWQTYPVDRWWYFSGDDKVLHQRLLMQVAWLDRMIGRLRSHLERQGLWDRALVVLVADHGISFRPGDRRRPLTPTNGCDLLPVPLFIKGPGQRSGGIDDRNVDAMDVLPTMAALLGIEVPFRLDGRPALGADHGRPEKVVLGPSWPDERKLPWTDYRMTFPPDYGLRCLREDRPNRDVAWGDGPLRPFRRGPFGELLGRPLNAAIVDEKSAGRVAFTAHDPRVPVAAGEAMCQVEGTITLPAANADGLDLVVAVNGTIEATGKSGGPGSRPSASPLTAAFSLPVSSAAFSAGGNEVRVFVASGEGSTVRLAPTELEPPRR